MAGKLALLKPLDGELESKPMPTADGWRQGETVALVGYPENDLLWNLLLVTTGVVSAGEWQDGVPVVNMAGEIVGLMDSGLYPFSYAVDLTLHRNLAAR